MQTGWKAALLQFVNGPLRAMGLHLSAAHQPTRMWDRIYKNCIRMGEAQGTDPCQVLDARWQGSPLDRWLADHILPYFQEGFAVCEIGAGIGRFAPHFAEHASSLVLCEPSAYACSILKRKFGGQGNVTVCQLNNNRLHGIPDASTDLVFAIAVFVHLELEAIYRYLEEIHRILKPGRAAVFEYASTTTPGGYAFFKKHLPPDGQSPVFRFHHPEDMRRLIRDHGFCLKKETIEQTEGYPEKVLVEITKV